MTHLVPFFKTHLVSIFKKHYLICEKYYVIKTHKIIKKKTEHIGITDKLISDSVKSNSQIKLNKKFNGFTI
jgi:hypothetical protein